jgi:hypothetical protein
MYNFGRADDRFFRRDDVRRKNADGDEYCSGSCSPRKRKRESTCARAR